MPETTTAPRSILLRSLRSPKFKKGLHISAIVFGFVCIGGCFVLASLTYILFGDCDGCEPKSDDKTMVKVMRILATALFLLGILLIALSLCCRGTENSLAPQVVVSSIPVEDLEKSPAPVLAYNHNPHRQAFVDEAAAMELPDFVTVVNNIDEIRNSSENENAGFWTEDVDGPVTPPPTYEEALVYMSWPTIAMKENSSQSSEETNSLDTGL